MHRLVWDIEILVVYIMQQHVEYNVWQEAVDIKEQYKVHLAKYLMLRHDTLIHKQSLAYDH